MLWFSAVRSVLLAARPKHVDLEILSVCKVCEFRKSLDFDEISLIFENSGISLSNAET
jgi:hypothetical protein